MLGLDANESILVEFIYVRKNRRLAGENPENRGPKVETT